MATGRKVVLVTGSSAGGIGCVCFSPFSPPAPPRLLQDVAVVPKSREADGQSYPPATPSAKSSTSAAASSTPQHAASSPSRPSRTRCARSLWTSRRSSLAALSSTRSSRSREGLMCWSTTRARPERELSSMRMLRAKRVQGLRCVSSTAVPCAGFCGICRRGPAVKTVDAVEADLLLFPQFETNFFAPLRLSKLVAVPMAERRSGLIVNIGSIVGESRSPSSSANLLTLPSFVQETFPLPGPASTPPARQLYTQSPRH